MTITAQTRRYGLIRPCPKCPFRTDQNYLRRDRANEIARTIQEGSEFACHETTEDDPDDESSRVDTAQSMVCAGSLLVMEHSGQPNQMARIAERTGAYDPSRLDTAAPVARSFLEFVQQHGEDPEDTGLVHCEVVWGDCEDPPGYSAGGGAVLNTDDPICDPENACADCGSAMCPACTSTQTNEYGDPLCLTCDDNDED